MTSQALTSIIAAVAAVVGGLIAVYGSVLTLRQARRAVSSEEQSLEQRLDELSATMKRSGKLLGQVEAELSARAATAARLKSEAETAESLAKLANDEREAVARLVRAEISAESKKSFRSGLRLNFAFFIAGAGASVLATLYIHPL